MSGAAGTEPRLARTAASTLVFHGLALAATTITGVIAARALGPAGRGELTVVLMATQMSSIVLSVGANQALPYHQAREPEAGPRLLATWLALAVPLGLTATALGYLLLPVLLDAQPHETLELARLYMLNAVLLIAAEVVFGFALGAHRFLFYNVMRFLGPGLVAVGYAVLWALDAFTVERAVATTAAVNAVLVAVAVRSMWRRHGIGRPDRALARRTLAYGVRAQATTVAGLVNLRLDLLIMPAFLAASSVGLYSVAGNVATMAVLLTNSLAVIALPLAARRPSRAARTIGLTLVSTLALAALAAAALAVFAGPLVRIVYGDDFEGAVDALRLLLPGTVLYAGSLVLFSGLNSLNRPLRAAAAQGVGVAVTVAGLVAFLPGNGIEAAAVVSTVAYTSVFCVALGAYRGAAGLRWRDVRTPPAGPPAGPEPAAIGVEAPAP